MFIVRSCSKAVCGNESPQLSQTACKIAIALSLIGLIGLICASIGIARLGGGANFANMDLATARGLLAFGTLAFGLPIILLVVKRYCCYERPGNTVAKQSLKSTQSVSTGSTAHQSSVSMATSVHTATQSSVSANNHSGASTTANRQPLQHFSQSSSNSSTRTYTNTTSNTSHARGFNQSQQPTNDSKAEIPSTTQTNVNTTPLQNAKSVVPKKQLSIETNLPIEHMFTQVTVGLDDGEKLLVKKVREGLIQFLGPYFELDEYGYIVDVKDETKLRELAKREDELATLFYGVAKLGDAAYTERIRTTLNALGIGCSQVAKGGGHKILDPNRPVSFVRAPNRSGKDAPPVYGKNKQPAYLDLWEYYIWKGYKEYRYNNFNKLSGLNDTEFTVFQLVDYQVKLQRIAYLHREGWLIGRVAELAEVRDFIGHRFSMANDILSTTLWPQENAKVTLKLFSESGDAPVGILIDGARVGKEDFGLSFSQNAFTVGKGFKNHKTWKHGAVSLSAQRGLLQSLDAVASQGLSIHGIAPQLSNDRKSYTLPQANARQEAVSQPSRNLMSSSQTKGQKNQISHNEQTFYRAAVRDIFSAFFVKSDSDHMPSALRSIIMEQDRARRSKGIYVPIFQFKGESNKLEEIIPDQLILSLLGLDGKVIPNPRAKSHLSIALGEAGINAPLAKAASNQIKNFSGTLKTLYDLQILMFNLKNIGGSLSILTTEYSQHGQPQQVFTQIRLLDNLHLVFPTIHKTKNPSSQKSDLFVDRSELQKLQKNAELQGFFSLSIRSSLKRFLGITIDPKDASKITFDPSILKMFDHRDPKCTDFAQVLSRAMQSAILFNIFGKETQKIVLQIVQTIRKTYPLMGITAANVDMILGSQEMQEIMSIQGLGMNLTPPFHAQSKPTGAAPLPIRPEAFKDFEKANIFGDPKEFTKALGQHAGEMVKYLGELGINIIGSPAIDIAKIESFRGLDEHLRLYETEVLQVISLVSLKDKTIAEAILKAMQACYPSFGLSAKGEPITNVKKRMVWIQQKLANKAPQTEFPFKEERVSQQFEESETISNSNASNKSEMEQAFMGRRLMIEDDDTVPTRGGTSVKRSNVSQSPFMNYQPETLKSALSDYMRQIIPPYAANSAQAQVAKELALVDSSGRQLWTVKPEFHAADKPKFPYLEPEDLLGANAVQLLTGPAFLKETVLYDQKTFRIHADKHILSRSNPQGDFDKVVNRMLTHTLAMTVEGDEQVLRPNGWHYSRAANVPMGGNIEYNAGNERFRFRDDSKRDFYKNHATKPYGGLGGYDKVKLDEVKRYDDQLLSDEERRLKRAGLLTSAYITVSAKGMGEERVPLDRCCKVLLINTMGPQFEKYESPEYATVDGTKSRSELEATDFIVKLNAPENKNPLFPEYYQNGTIPSHQTIKSSNAIAPIGSQFDKPYVQLTDGTFFNRQAYQEANNLYLNSVVNVANERMQNEPYYLKATLFGGGFFADTKKAGNLRPEVVYAMVESYKTMLQQNAIPKGSVIEFPRYGAKEALPPSLLEELRREAKRCGVALVWADNGDLFDFRIQKDLEGNPVDPTVFEKNGRVIVLNAGDAMSWCGNEKNSASVEAMIGNNSNLRLVMNWWANPHILA